MTDQKHSAKTDFVESIVTNMVERDLDVQDAVAQVLDTDELPESVDMDMEDPSCQQCGNTELEFGVTEQDGEEYPTIYCSKCDIGYVAEGEVGDSEDDDESYEEVAIDFDNPTCPDCNQQLEAQVVEDEGEEFDVLYCEKCDVAFVPGDDEEES